jgi:hypothetical protein
VNGDSVGLLVACDSRVLSGHFDAEEGPPLDWRGTTLPAARSRRCRTSCMRNGLPVMRLTMFLVYEMSAGTARERLRVTTERRVDLMEVAMTVSASLMGVGQLSFD